MSHRAFLSAAAAAVLLACSGAHATVVKEAAGPVQQVLTAKDKVGQTTQTPCSAGFVNVVGASLRITIPPGPNQLVTARFDADATISQPSMGYAAAFAQIVAGGHVVQPGYDAVAVNSTSLIVKPTTLARSVVLAPGAHYVLVQYCAYSSAGETNLTAAVSQWQLTVEAAPLQ